MLLTDRDLDAIKRPKILIAFLFTSFVQARLADDGVDRDRRFASRAVANDQLALTATNRNHRVDRHDSGLDRLTAALPLDHSRSDFFERIKCFSLDRSFVVQRLTEGVYHATEKRFANRNLEKFSRSLRFVAF